MDRLLDLIVSFLPLLGTAAGVFFFLLGVNWVLLVRHPELGNERKFSRQLAMLGLTLAGVVAIALALPVSDSTRNQVIALIGVLLSGVVLFSSTTIAANLMAGIMLRMTRAFRTGDFIRVGEHFGRITERGLLDTEIQTEHRELVSLPNTYLISHPVTVVRSSGTIISGTLSLGYDVHHSRVQNLLLTAARETGLDEPFVQIVELGNYAITYRINGLLTEVKSMITIQSNLYRKILDTLHGEGIGIVSPTFMNQRRLVDENRIVPPSIVDAPPVDSLKPEEIVFDKAEQAEQLEKAKQHLQDEIKGLESQSKLSEGEEKQRIAGLIDRKRSQLAELEGSEEKMNGEPPEIAGQTAPLS